MPREPAAPLPSFDPRELPAFEAHDGLPPVPAERLSEPALRERFANPPPWQPEQAGDRFRIDRGDPRAAAVLVPIVVREQRSTLLLTQRTWNLRHHSGQVAFPGGRLESFDASPVHAALREAQEEIGLEPARVEVIGPLPEYLTGTGFLVTPIVGLLHPGFALRPDPSEVADVFEVPLDFLMNPRHHQRRSIRIEGGAERTFFTMPYRVPGETEERFIWGATAAMLRNLYRLLIA